MKFIIGLSLFALLVANAAAYSDSCTKGPEYWCQDMATAADCGAIRHCQENVWLGKTNNIRSASNSKVARFQPVHPGNISLSSIQCTFCKYVIGLLENATATNKTPAFVIAELEKICNVLPGALKNECTALAVKYGNIIAVLLLTNATAVQICDFIKFCNNGTQEMKFQQEMGMSQHSKQNPSMSDLTRCAICTSATKYVANKRQQKNSLAVTKHALESFCNFLSGIFPDECNGFVRKYGLRVIQHFLKFNQTNLICQSLSQC